MDKETLYDLRSLLAQYPYYQTARLLLLQNLYLLHDVTFDEELRQAAIYITDRKVLFKLIEMSHYKIRNSSAPSLPPAQTDQKETPKKKESKGNRTMSLIDTSSLIHCPRKATKRANKPNCANQHPPMLLSIMWLICSRQKVKRMPPTQTAR